MIPVLENSEGRLAPIHGNPVLKSLDGEARAPLATILHESWTAEDRLRFGVHLVEPVDIPRGKRQIGAPGFSKDEDGQVRVVLPIEDAPKPAVEVARDPLSELRVQMADLARRLAVLEQGAKPEQGQP
jgi:hypothetical protein